MVQHGSKSRSSRLRRGGLLSGVAAIAVASAVIWGPDIAVDLRGTPALAQEAPGHGTLPGSFAGLAEKVKPAVVNIATTQKVERERAMRSPFEGFQFPPGSPFEEFFKQFRPDMQGRRAPPGPSHALGSGFIVDKSGYVVTNNHVIGEADEIMVTLSDGSQYEAKIVGRDSKTDLALLKIDAGKDLPYVEFGDSNKTRVGDWVLAVGNPFGLGGTVTAGIVSASGRDIHAGPYDDFLQIDAAINRGNSGGPTFNLNGEVVGVNTAIYSPNGGNIGIGFAIPSDLAKTVVADLRDDGRVDRGWLGVSIQPVTGDLAESLGLDEAKGALVAEVTPDSPAAKAGLRQGDVIVSYDGAAIKDLRDLTRGVAETKAGAEAKLVVWRNGAEKRIEATIGAMQQQQVAAAESHEPGEATLGMAVAPLTPDMKEALELDSNAKGLVVRDVERGSAAAKRGIREGDVILGVNQRPVASRSDLVQQLEEARKDGRKSALLLLSREGNQRFVAVDLA